MKNLYLDVDGVLFDEQGKPALDVVRFLNYIMEQYDVYWLTTHCKGDPRNVQAYVNRYLPGVEQYVMKIKPTTWDRHKTEGIDFSKDFIWLDDNPSPFDREVLVKNKCLKSLKIVTLYDNEYNLMEDVIFNVFGGGLCMNLICVWMCDGYGICFRNMVSALTCFIWGMGVCGAARRQKNAHGCSACIEYLQRIEFILYSQNYMSTHCNAHRPFFVPSP